MALVLSLITFVGSGTAQAIAEGQLGVPVVKAQVMDDGTVNINPIHLKNSHDTQIKVQSSRFETEAEAYFDEEMRAATCGIEGLGGTVYAGPAEGEYYYGNAYDRIAPGEVGDFNISITGLSAEKANSYLDKVVYVAEITFEDAVVPAPVVENFTYDGAYHQGVQEDLDHYYFPEGGDAYHQDVNFDETKGVMPYKTLVRLLPGFVWDEDVDVQDPEGDIELEWWIYQRELIVETNTAEKDYDMTPLVGTAQISEETPLAMRQYGIEPGPVPEYEQIDTEVAEAQEVIGFKDFTDITHYYEGLNEEGELVGKQNRVEINWEPEVEVGEVAAKETNYAVGFRYGTLTINQIEFKHLENWFGEDIPVDGVDAPDQEYPYNAQEQGEPISYLTLEELSHETHPWILTKSDKYYDPAQSPELYSPGPKTIVNVSESGEVQYVVESTVATDESGPHIGDYKTTIGKYNLTITPRELDKSELDLLILDGDETSGSSALRYNRYDFERDDEEPIIPNFGTDPSMETLPSLRIKIGSVDVPITDDALTAFEFDGDDSATKAGDYYSTLIAKDKSDGNIANNFTGSLQIPYHVYQKTNITYTISSEDWALYKNEVDEDNLIDPTSPGTNNPIYAEEDSIVASISSPAPSPVAPVIIEISAHFSGEETRTISTVEATLGNTEFTVPSKDGVYADDLQITKKATPTLTFTDNTKEGIEDRPEEAGMENYYSTVKWQLGSTTGTWSDYDNDHPKNYPFGTKLEPAGGSYYKTDTPAYNDNDVTYFWISPGKIDSTVEPPIDTTDYVAMHFKEYQPTESYKFDDNVNVEYVLEANRRYQVKYTQGENPDYQVAATIPWPDTGITHDEEACAIVINVDSVYPGTTITFAAPESPADWNPAHGWDVDIFVNDTHKKVYPNDPTYTTLDYVTQIEVEPFALINLVDSTGVTPAATTFTCNVCDLEGHKKYTVDPYVTSAACGIYAPKGSSLIPDEGFKTKLNCFPEYFVFHDTDLIISFSGVDSMFEFIANPASRYEFDGWDAAGYKVVYDETSVSPVGDNPSYTISVTSSLKPTHKLYWPEAYVSEATVDGEIITEQGTEVYEGSNVSLKVSGGTTGLRATFGVDIGDVPESNYNLLASEEAYQPFTFSMPSETNTTDCHVSAIPYRAMTFGEPILVDKTLDDVRFNLPTVQILDEDSGWITYDPETMKFPFDYIDKFVEDETVAGAIYTSFVENTSEAREYYILTEIYIKVDGVDAAFDFNGWSLPTSNAEVDATYKFKQKSADTLVKVECTSDSFEGFTNPITITDQKGNVYNSAPEDPSNPTWNYAQKTTESAPTDITVTGDSTELAGCKLKVEYPDSTTEPDEIDFTSGIATIPADKITQNIKLTIEKPTPAGHTISLGSSFKQLYEDCEGSATVDCFINDEKFDNAYDTITTSEDAISLKLGISLASSSMPNEGMISQFVFNNCDSSGKIIDWLDNTDPIDAVSEESYTFVWNVEVSDISDFSEYVEIQIAKHWMTYIEDPVTFNFKWSNDPSSDVRLYKMSQIPEGSWAPEASPCYAVGIDIPMYGRAEIGQVEIGGLSVDAIIVYNAEGDDFSYYGLWDNNSQAVGRDQYTMNISLNTHKYDDSIGLSSVIGSDQYVFAVTPATANNNDSNGGGSYESPRFYDDGQDNGGGFEYLGDDTWAIQILRKFDLFHIFF